MRGAGNDTVNSGYRNDIFALKAGEDSDTIKDFSRGVGDWDKIGLAGGLTFAQLAFSGSPIQSSSELLATLTGIKISTLKLTDFFSYLGSTTGPL
jgi:Ca2+-binding RTX toxin-like protein